MDLGLSGKNVLMFGGNATIGYATSLSFAKEGANLLIASRDVEASQKIATKAMKLGSQKAFAVKADATKWEDVEAAVKLAQDKLFAQSSENADTTKAPMLREGLPPILVGQSEKTF